MANEFSKGLVPYVHVEILSRVLQEVAQAASDDQAPRGRISDPLHNAIMNKELRRSDAVGPMLSYLHLATQNGLLENRDIRGIALLMLAKPDFVLAIIRRSLKFETLKRNVQKHFNAQTLDPQILQYFF